MRFMTKSKPVATKQRRFTTSTFFLLAFLIGLMAWTTAAEAAPSHTQTVTSAHTTEQSSYRASNDELSHLNGGGPGWTGLRGPRGWTGFQGPRGWTGFQGPRGWTGLQGATGSQGPRGATGSQGPRGATGLTGATGPAGPIGPSQYGYIYNQAAQVVAIEGDVTLDTNGLLTAGITHTAGTSQILFSSAGIYKVTFSVSGVEPNQFALFVNGVLATGTVYGSGAGTQQNIGQAFITLAAGDVLTLRNHSSAAAVTLQTLAGGTQTNVNASVTIEKLQ